MSNHSKTGGVYLYSSMSAMQKYQTKPLLVEKYKEVRGCV